MSRFKKIKNVTLPLLKMANNTPYYLKLTGPIFQGKQISGAKEGDKPADLVNCINLETGEECQIIVAAVLKTTIQEEYEEHNYVGKCFEIVKYRDTEKRYNTFTVAEVEEPASDEGETPTETKPTGKKK